MAIKEAYRGGKKYLTDMREVAPGKFLAEDAAHGLTEFLDQFPIARQYLSNIRSAYRTMAEQTALWQKYGPPRAARPGYGSHQEGMAMDVDEPLRGMLAAHGEKYGWARTIAAEPWHFQFSSKKKTGPTPSAGPVRLAGIGGGGLALFAGLAALVGLSGGSRKRQGRGLFTRRKARKG